MDRKPVFDAVRKILGRAFTQTEVDYLDRAIDEGFAQFADEMGERPEWLDLAIPILHRFEGFGRLMPSGKVQAYPDPATGGKPWTIGYGSTTDEHGQPIPAGTVWTKERAEKRFEKDVKDFARHIDSLLEGMPATPHQKAALVSWVYNVGVGNARNSTLIKKHKAGNYAGAAKEFARWNRAAGKVMRGLTRRRKAEAELYLS